MDNKLQPKKRIRKIIDDMTLFDDVFMSLVFDENIEATQEVLRIVLQQDDITVIHVKGQNVFKNPLTDGRNIQIDVYAKDSTGREFDVEIQRGSDGAHERRARFHSSMLDARMLKSGQNFKDLRDSYVIFFCEEDKLGDAKPLYHINRTIEESGKIFDDGSHIIYVNGEYESDDPLGRLIKDFKCKNAADIANPALANSVAHQKETMKGESKMSIELMKFAEEQKAEGKAEGQNQLARLIDKLLDNNQIQDIRKVNADPIYRQKLMAEFGI